METDRAEPQSSLSRAILGLPVNWPKAHVPERRGAGPLAKEKADFMFRRGCTAS